MAQHRPAGQGQVQALPNTLLPVAAETAETSLQGSVSQQFLLLNKTDLAPLLPQQPDEAQGNLQLRKVFNLFKQRVE